MARTAQGRSSSLAFFILRPSSLILLVAAAGCGGSGLVSVSGSVKLDGQPLDGATVTFHPVKGGAVATATTDSAGRFTVATGAQKGLAPGEYEVAIQKTGPAPAGTGLEREVPPPVITPLKYANPKTSGLKYTAPGGAADFEMSSK